MLPDFFLFLLKTHNYKECHFEKKQKRKKTDVTREGDNLPNKYRAEYKQSVQKDISKIRSQECLHKHTEEKETGRNKKDANIFTRCAKRKKK